MKNGQFYPLNFYNLRIVDGTTILTTCVKVWFATTLGTTYDRDG